VGVTGGAQPRDFQLTEGATIKGRVIRDGQPLPNVSVGAVSVDRNPENYTGEYETGTDTNGQFTFINLPHNLSYQIYGLMKSFNERGATKVLIVKTGGDGSVTDAGALETFPAHRISGRVVLSDGKPIPPKTRLLVRRSGLWDSVLADLAKDGSFSVVGIPSGIVDVTIEMPGYHTSFKNESFDPVNPDRLIGRINRDLASLVILMDKGTRLESHFDENANEMDLPENHPLAGVEHSNDHTHQQMISGRVTDKQTGQPIANFRITPGLASPFSGINWNPQRAIDGSNGTYVIYLNKGESAPALMIEASGYMPVASPELPPGQGNFDFVLTKGNGPSGVVLLPDGKPASSASVTLICPPDELRSMQLSGGGTFDVFRHRQRLVTADATGHFSFAPELDMHFIAAASPGGLNR
jgi:hypothetical protein